MNAKIQLTDNMNDVFFKMSQGNPGALTVLVQLLEQTPIIDPDALLKGLGSILALDTLGIRGSEIWILYKDVCGESIIEVLLLLRAHQLGIISSTEILNAVRDWRRMDAYEFIPEMKAGHPDLSILQHEKEIT